MKQLCRAAFVLILLSPTGGRAAAPPLRLCYEDVPQAPWTMPDGTGLNLVVLQTVQHRLREHFVFLPMPWKRCLEEVRHGQVDGVFASADTPDRRSFAVGPTLADGRPDTAAALYSDPFNFYFRIGSEASWNGRDLQLGRGKVIVQRGYYVAELLRERGVDVNEAIKTADEGFRMLAAGVADAAVIQGRDAELLSKTDPRFRASIGKAATPYAVLPLYLLIGRASYQKDEARIKAIWAGIRTVVASPEYKKQENAAFERMAHQR